VLAAATSRGARQQRTTARSVGRGREPHHASTVPSAEMTNTSVVVKGQEPIRGAQNTTAESAMYCPARPGHSDVTPLPSAFSIRHVEVDPPGNVT
jgi:hypothetical protein